MSSKLYGFDSSTFIPAPDFQASQNEESLWEGSQTFSIARDAWDYFTGSVQLLVGQPATVLDPTLPNFWSFLRLTRVETQNQSGGFSTVRVHYAGYYSLNQSQDPDSGSPTTFSLAGTIEEVSLLEHPKVVALSGEERSGLSKIAEGAAVWDITNSEIGSIDDESGAFTAWDDQDISSSDGIAFADLLAAGESTYKRPSFTWTKSYSSESSLPNSSINDLGKISDPDGSPPEPAGTRNWMMISADQTQTSSTDPVYDIQISWMLSDAGGWDSTLYD